MRGFSLVELSIVLVILGLLTGGILAGQNLIRAAEIRSVSTQLQQYSAAVYTFRDKYFALPGDFKDATKFWGAQDGGDGLGTDCTNVASTSALTCNGNGNGQVADCSYEVFRFWQHLANAGLIEGNYTGVQDTTACNHTMGLNTPTSKLTNAGVSFSYLNFSGDGGTYQHDFGHLFWFGRDSGHRTQAGALSPEEAWNIDTKLDDGLPGRGAAMMRSDNGWGAANACSTSTAFTDYDGEYNFSHTGKVCALMISIDGH